MIDKRGEVGVGARRRTAFELKRALSGQVSKLIEGMNEALKILSDISERCLVEVGRLVIQWPDTGQPLPQLHQIEHRSHRHQRRAQVLRVRDQPCVLRASGGFERRIYPIIFCALRTSLVC